MEAKDLRIGNIVSGIYCDSPNKEREQITINEITSIGVNLEYGDTMYYEDTLQGIPLTEEWLLKFGFEKNVYNSEKHGFGVDYILEVDNGQLFNFTLTYCDDFSLLIQGCNDDLGVAPPLDLFKYVHQLQNLYFALTGEELTIKGNG